MAALIVEALREGARVWEPLLFIEPPWYPVDRSVGKHHVGRHRSSYWTVVRTKFDEELDALRNVKSQEFECYLPRFRDRVDRHGVRRVRVLFPGYLFVSIEKSRDWSPIRSTRGVHSMMYEGDAPARVLHEDIQRFKDMEDERGYVVLEECEPPQFGLGDIVLAFGGACAGHLGCYAGRGSTPSRGLVIFEMLQRAVKMEVSLYDLA